MLPCSWLSPCRAIREERATCWDNSVQTQVIRSFLSRIRSRSFIIQHENPKRVEPTIHRTPHCISFIWIHLFQLTILYLSISFHSLDSHLMRNICINYVWFYTLLPILITHLIKDELFQHFQFSSIVSTLFSFWRFCVDWMRIFLIAKF